MPSENFFQEILRLQRVEYAACDAARRVYDYSPGLMRLVKLASGPMRGRRLEDLFDELTGAETDLDTVRLGILPAIHLDRIHHIFPDGQEGYVSIRITPFPPGLLLVASDVTTEGLLEQRITQQRNELDLLASELVHSRTILDNLLHRFVARSVTQRVVTDSTGVKPLGERRTISVLFVDMRGYTPLIEQLEPNALLSLINEHFVALGNVIAIRGGTINQAAGDMIVAFFNAPEDQPDHALRAVQAALDAQASLKTLYASGLPYDIQFGIGVDTGMAVVGYVGDEHHTEYTAIGAVAQTAARLSGVAQGGRVLLSASTYELVKQTILADSIGPVTMKDRAEPMLAYEALNVG